MSTVDAIFGALADSRRRHALGCLLEHRTVALADLAELVAEREAGEQLATIPAEQVSRVYFSLYHTHVPKLEAAELVLYEQEEDVVRSTDRTRGALTDACEAIDSLLPTGCAGDPVP